VRGPYTRALAGPRVDESSNHPADSTLSGTRGSLASDKLQGVSAPLFLLAIYAETAILNKKHKSMATAAAAPAEIARTSSLASRVLKAIPGSDRSAALTVVFEHLQAAKDQILEANRKDLEAAEEQAKAGKLSLSLIKRLDLWKPGKWEDMVQGILDVRDLEDPGEQ